MKKIPVLICFLFCSCTLLAQTPVVPNKTDSLPKISKLIPATLKRTDGLSMLSTIDAAENISRSAELSVFYKAIQVAGLQETFKSNGPITVFAPNNQAFANLPQGKLDTLLMPGHKYDLTALVTYHIIAGIITTRDITRAISSNKGLATFTTITGSKLTAKIDANRNIVLIDENGGQSIISRFDIGQSNGLIHIANAVLIPRFKNI